MIHSKMTEDKNFLSYYFALLRETSRRCRPQESWYKVIWHFDEISKLEASLLQVVGDDSPNIYHNDLYTKNFYQATTLNLNKTDSVDRKSSLGSKSLPLKLIIEKLVKFSIGKIVKVFPHSRIPKNHTEKK